MNISSTTLFRTPFVLALLLGSAAQSGFSQTQETATANWSQFRGPGGNGTAEKSRHPASWSEDKNILWKVNTEGVAWSQPIVWGNQILLTTATAKNQPTPRVGESGPGFSLFSSEGISRSFLGGGDPPDMEYEWKLHSLDLKTGKPLWETLVRKSKPTIPTHRSNSYASETPVTDGHHIFVYLAMTGIYCFDMEGNEVWNKPLNAYSMQYGWGTGSSPVLHDGTLFLQCDNEKESFVLALSSNDGHQKWRVDRDEKSNWSTPYVWNNTKRTELVTCGGNMIRSYEPATGELLWSMKAEGRCATSAIGNSNLLFVGSVSRSMGRSATLSAIRPGAQGNLTASKPESTDNSVVWSVKRASPELASPVLCNERLYAVKQQGGIITCFDANSGKQLYRERLPGASGFTASPWTSSGRVFCLDETGTTYVLAATDELKIAGRNKLDGMFWSSAAIKDDLLLLRSSEFLYCIKSVQ